MKKISILRYLLVGMAMALITSCSDFFEPDNNTILNGKDYIKENSELYSGFLGIITKVQAIGDKAIYLTDTRAELLEPTQNTPGSLYSLYNYDDDLSGNTYADPAKYYDVIIACNDFMQKAKEYRDTHESSLDMDHYRGLISSAVRVKVWIYMTLAKIYGQAVWFDDPMQSLVDISGFETKDMDELFNACENLLATGFDGINGTYIMPWREWLDPSNTDEVTSSVYDVWNLMVPEYFILQAEISLWKGNYQQTLDLILGEMNKKFADPAYGGNVATIKYMRTGSYGSANGFGRWFDNTNPEGYATESVIIYNYQYNQQNSLLKHFDTTGEYMLRASLAGIKRYKDITYNPPADQNARETSDTRFKTFRTVLEGEEYAVQKYRGIAAARHTVAHDDVQINIYHTSDLYFMLVEALNNLGRYEEASVLMNQGIDSYFGAADVDWPGFNNNWTTHPDADFRRTSGDKGIRGIFGLGKRDMRLEPDAEYTDDMAVKRHNDLEILKEAMLEFPCEGKTYPMMIRFAKRWNDYSLISRFVCEKYTDESKKAEIKNKIENNKAYFVPWDLNSTSSSH